MDKNEDILKKIYLFSKFTDKELSTLANRATRVTLNTGHSVFNEGNLAKSMFVVVYGTLNVTTSGSTGQDINITTIAAGEHLGEFPFIDNEKRSANAEASEKTELLEIAYSDLAEVLKGSLEMEMKFYKELSHFLVSRVRVLTNDVTHARDIRRRFA
jgi:CRP/FNR family transcriptional regulator, cyclic AMP receptor protein